MSNEMRDWQADEIQELKGLIKELEADVEALKGRCRDMYANDDGQAWDETEKLFARKGWSLELPHPLPERS